MAFPTYLVSPHMPGSHPCAWHALTCSAIARHARACIFSRFCICMLFTPPTCQHVAIKPWHVLACTLPRMPGNPLHVCLVWPRLWLTAAPMYLCMPKRHSRMLAAFLLFASACWHPAFAARLHVHAQTLRDWKVSAIIPSALCIVSCNVERPAVPPGLHLHFLAHSTPVGRIPHHTPLSVDSCVSGNLAH